MVTPRFRWFAIGCGAAVFSGLLSAPYHSQELVLLPEPGWLYRLDSGAPVSRAVHLALHLAAVWLAAGLLEKLPSPRAARIALLLYAIHPLQTQALASLEARPLLTAAVLSLLALRLWLQGRTWFAVSCGLLAVLADWSAAALPGLLWLWSGVEQRRDSAAPLGVLTGVAFAAVIKALGESVTLSLDYLLWQGLAVLRTTGIFTAPIGLSADPGVRGEPLQALSAWAVIGVAVFLLAASRGGPRRWLASALIALAPTCSVFATPQLAWEPRAALALVFLCGAAGWLLAGTELRLLAPAAALFALVTAVQVQTWRSERSVWLEAARLAPGKPEPLRRLARLVDPAYALELLEQARPQAPDDPVLALDLAEAFARAGRPTMAEIEMARAWRLAGCAQASGTASREGTGPCATSAARSR